MPKLQQQFVSVLRRVLPQSATVVEEHAPDWLIRPGPVECGERWGLVRAVYHDLTSDELPETMPPRERRRLDVIVTYSDGHVRAIEVDETQHFTSARSGLAPERWTPRK